MRTVVPVDRGVIELNWMWLPAFIGMDSVVRRDLQKQVIGLFEGKDLTDSVLHDAHCFVVGFLCSKYPAVDGLDLYLDALKFIELK